MPRRKPKALKSSPPEKEGSSESDKPQLQEEECKQPGVESSPDGVISDGRGDAEQLPSAKRLKDEGEEVTVKSKAKSKLKVEAEEGKPSDEAKLEAEEELLEEKPKSRSRKRALAEEDKPSSQAKLETEEGLLEEKPRGRSKKKAVAKEDKPSSQAKLEPEELLEEKARVRGKKKAVSKEDKPSSQEKLEAEEDLLEEKPHGRSKKKAIAKEDKPSSQAEAEELLEEKARIRGKKKAVSKEDKPSSQAKLEAEEEFLEEKSRARGKKKAVAENEEEEEKRPVKHTELENEESATIQSMPAVVQKAAKKKGKGKAVAKVSDAKKGQMGEKANQGGAAKAPSQRQYWLMKSEAESRLQKGVDMKFSIADLQNEPNQTTCWDGVRNYQARNFMRDEMKVGDFVFFYHSNCKDPGIAGIVEIVREGYVDPTQFDPSDPHYDPKSVPEDAKWYMVDVKFVRLLKRFISLSELRSLRRDHVKAESGGSLAGMALFTMGRLSVQPVTKEEFDFILSLEEKIP